MVACVSLKCPAKISSYATPMISLVTAVVLALLGTICFYGHFGAMRNCTFIAGALVLSAIPFLIASGYQFSERCN